MPGDADIASIAALMGNPARGAMLGALMGGRALPAGELARVARVSPSARSCYDHLAGALGVALADRLCVLGALEPGSLGLADPAPFRALGVDASTLGAGRRPVTRSCLDWSERRPHLAGELGAVTLEALLHARWLARRPKGRAIAVTRRGGEGFREALGLDVLAAAPGCV